MVHPVSVDATNPAGIGGQVGEVSGNPWGSGPVVLGCGSFGGIGGATDLIGRGHDEAASMATLDEAASLGITMLDTAERYAAGASDKMIGRWLSERSSWVTSPIRRSTSVEAWDESSAMPSR